MHFLDVIRTKAPPGPHVLDANPDYQLVVEAVKAITSLAFLQHHFICIYDVQSMDCMHYICIIMQQFFWPEKMFFWHRGFGFLFYFVPTTRGKFQLPRNSYGL